MTSFTEQGKKYLVCGDIGGNAAKRKTLELYIIEEPQWSEASTSKEKAVAKVVSELTVQFADGITDFESLAFDQEGSRFLLVEKGLLGDESFPYLGRTNRENILSMRHRLGVWPFRWPPLQISHRWSLPGCSLLYFSHGVRATEVDCKASHNRSRRSVGAVRRNTETSGPSLETTS